MRENPFSKGFPSIDTCKTSVRVPWLTAVVLQKPFIRFYKRTAVISQPFLLCFEDVSHKVVEVCMDGVIAVVACLVVMPDMRNAVLSEVVVIILRIIVNDRVIAAGCYVEEIW